MYDSNIPIGWEKIDLADCISFINYSIQKNKNDSDDDNNDDNKVSENVHLKKKFLEGFAERCRNRWRDMGRAWCASWAKCTKSGTNESFGNFCLEDTSVFTYEIWMHHKGIIYTLFYIPYTYVYIHTNKQKSSTTFQSSFKKKFNNFFGDKKHSKLSYALHTYIHITYKHFNQAL